MTENVTEEEMEQEIRKIFHRFLRYMKTHRFISLEDICWDVGVSYGRGRKWHYGFEIPTAQKMKEMELIYNIRFMDFIKPCQRKHFKEENTKENGGYYD